MRKKTRPNRCMKHLPTSCLCYYCRRFFSHEVIEEKKEEKQKRSNSSCRRLLFSRAMQCNIVRIMMINKNDRRGDSYLAALHTCVARLLEEDNDEISIGMPRQ